MADTALIVVPHRDIRSVEENCSLGGGRGLLGMASPAANVDALDGSGRGRAAESASQGHGLQLPPANPAMAAVGPPRYPRGGWHQGQTPQYPAGPPAPYGTAQPPTNPQPGPPPVAGRPSSGQTRRCRTSTNDETGRYATAHNGAPTIRRTSSGRLLTIMWFIAVTPAIGGDPPDK